LFRRLTKQSTNKLRTYPMYAAVYNIGRFADRNFGKVTTGDFKFRMVQNICLSYFLRKFLLLCALVLYEAAHSGPNIKLRIKISNHRLPNIAGYFLCSCCCDMDVNVVSNVSHISYLISHSEDADTDI
jgi:hypothetical protein